MPGASRRCWPPGSPDWLKNWNFLKLFQSPEDRWRMHDLMTAAGLPE
jgi:hypothetical protein